MAVETVVLVPGIGFGGGELFLLARRLRRLGWQPVLFPHLPGRCPLNESGERLYDMVSSLEGDTVHFVAHSLGGIVTLQMFARHPDLRPGRIVLMGTPLLGSVAGRRTLALPGGRFLLGQGAASLVTKDPDAPLPPDRDVGVIAGRLNILLGLLLAPGRANDTIISVEETRHPQATDHLTLPVSHSSMLLSSRVALAVDRFLRTGTFLSAAEGDTEGFS